MNVKDVWKSTTTVAGEQSAMIPSASWTRQLPVLSWDLGKSDAVTVVIMYQYRV